MVVEVPLLFEAAMADADLAAVGDPDVQAIRPRLRRAAADLARRRRTRGLRLNLPEATALITKIFSGTLRAIATEKTWYSRGRRRCDPCA